MKVKILTIVTLSLGLAVSLSSCTKDDINTYDCTGITPTYTNDIKPILDAKCATSGCHSANSRAAGRDYSSYSAAKNAADDDAFLGSVQQLSGYNKMPRGGSKLSDSQLQLMYCWVNNGFPEN